jgi:hypothetical protein
VYTNVVNGFISQEKVHPLREKSKREEFKCDIGLIIVIIKNKFTGLVGNLPVQNELMADLNTILLTIEIDTNEKDSDSHKAEPGFKKHSDRAWRLYRSAG